MFSSRSIERLTGTLLVPSFVAFPAHILALEAEPINV